MKARDMDLKTYLDWDRRRAEICRQSAAADVEFLSGAMAYGSVSLSALCFINASVSSSIFDVSQESWATY